jgi:hypothetical protein
MVVRLALALLMCSVCARAASGETTVTYEAETSYDTNYFGDTNRVAAMSLRTGLGFEGEIEREGTKFGYSFHHQEVFVPKYRFADEHNSWVNFSLSRQISEKLEWTAQMRGTRSDAGDIDYIDGGKTFGFRRLDHKIDLSTAATLDALGGKSTLTASYTNLMKGKARLPQGFETRIDANEALLGLKASHVRVLAGGEAGVTFAYNASLIPERQREADLYLRFPATNMRGSLAYGRTFGDRLTVLMEAGLTTIAGDEVGNQVKRTRPYLRAEAEWKLNDRLSLGAAYSRDYALYDIDDPLGEYQRRWKAVIKTKPTKSLTFDLAVERSHKDWIFYDYNSGERRLVATLGLDAGHDRKIEIEFARLLHDELDTADAYRGSSVSTRFSGSF